MSSSYSGYTNTYSQARISYYGISGIPTFILRWYNKCIWRQFTEPTASYLTKYNQRIAVTSNFTIAMNGMHNGLDYTVVLTVEKVNPYSGTNLVAHLALTESDLNYGGSTYNHVTRLFVPGASGTPVNFTTKSHTDCCPWIHKECKLGSQRL